MVRFQHYLAAGEQPKALALTRSGKSVLALAVRWVLDHGPTIALCRARSPERLEPLEQIEGWRIDEGTSRDIEAILARCIVDQSSAKSMAPSCASTAGQAELCPLKCSGSKQVWVCLGGDMAGRTSWGTRVAGR